ncbi:hypothetical protein B0H19DRAFT_1232588 [Mycena capillaripes]|nr:hypothetical protein B0H19DRAFT_1232588 [Mycena capillaripes]
MYDVKCTLFVRPCVGKNEIFVVSVAADLGAADESESESVAVGWSPQLTSGNSQSFGAVILDAKAVTGALPLCPLPPPSTTILERRCRLLQSFLLTTPPRVLDLDYIKMVSLWDIDLQHEICLDSSTGVVDWHRSQPSVRRMYSAKIGGQSTTVAMYQGYGAEEVLHPKIIQICGAASSRSIGATIFHDGEPLFYLNILSRDLILELDLIPFEQYVNFYRHSHFSTIYIYACCVHASPTFQFRYIDSLKIAEFSDISKYFYSNFQQDLTSEDCTFWIRHSTGRLCADLAEPTIISWLYDFWSDANTQRVPSWNAPNKEAMIIESLTLRNYHQICTFHLPRSRGSTISGPIHANLGTAVFWLSANRFEDSIGIAFSPNVMGYHRQWQATGGASGERTEGWMRTLKLACWLSGIHCLSWLSQANYIFSCLHMLSKFEDCGFLFLCPEEEFQIGPCSFCWPDCPAYWPIDPFRVDRLTPQEATDFGFPSLELTIWIGGSGYDNSVYIGIREFQRAESFDPESQDVARLLRYPLYYPFNKMDPLFAYGEDDEVQTSAEEDDYSTDNEDEKENNQIDLMGKNAI